MANSRYSAKGPSHHNTHRVSAPARQYSTRSANDDVDNWQSSNRDNTNFEDRNEKRERLQHARGQSYVSTGKDDSHPVRVYVEDLPPTKPIRRTTGSSILSAASTAWTTTKQYAISHFTVPHLAAPWEHNIPEKHEFSSESPSNTVRHFDHRGQRQRLFVNSAFQWLITAAICAAMAGTLYGFSTLNYGITNLQKRTFNALITGLSIILGLNLSSSLQGYASLMRWRFLASRYRTLQDFELIMNCESQSKVFRLLWAGRNRGQWYPSKTQIYAFLWLTINVVLQVITALLGLTYSIDISDTYVMQTYGDVNVADLSYIYSYESDYTFSGQAAVAHEFGIAGQDYDSKNTTLDDTNAAERTIYHDDAGDLYWYHFIDRSADNWEEDEVSSRIVTTQATCQSFKVVAGGFAGFDDIYDKNITYIDQYGDQQTFYVDPTAQGCTTWMSDEDPTGCGPRCTQIWALQSADNDTSSVPHPLFWQCNNTVGQVTNTDQYQNSSLYQMPDEQARIMAGAIGWSGFTTQDDSLEYVVMPYGSEWSPLGGINETAMAQLVMMYTAGAFAALDFQGERVNVSGYYPIPAQVIDVQWQWAALILALLPFIQFLILLCVIIWANKAIIKDTSFLSTARLLKPVVDKLGDRGCLLTGDEIAEELGNFKIRYGVRSPNGYAGGRFSSSSTAVRHLDLIEEVEGFAHTNGRMPPGRYDGMIKDDDVNDDGLNRRKSKIKRRLSL